MKKLCMLLEETYVKENAFLLKDEVQFMKQRICFALVSGLLTFIVSLCIGKPQLCIMGIIVFMLVYKAPIYMLKKYKDKQQRSVNSAFLIWILQLEALVLSNNISNSIKKSVQYCPDIIKDEVYQLAKKVELEPMNKNHYLSFLKAYQTLDINEVLLSLYQFNFVKKEDLAYDFALIHHRIDKLKLKEQENNYRIQADNWGLVLMSCPILGMSWSMYFCVQLNEIIFNMI